MYLHESKGGRFLTEYIGKETCHKVWFGEVGPRPQGRRGTSSRQGVIKAQGKGEEDPVRRSVEGH